MDLIYKRNHTSTPKKDLSKGIQTAVDECNVKRIKKIKNIY